MNVKTVIDILGVVVLLVFVNLPLHLLCLVTSSTLVLIRLLIHFHVGWGFRVAHGLFHLVGELCRFGSASNCCCLCSSFCLLVF